MMNYNFIQSVISFTLIHWILKYEQFENKTYKHIHFTRNSKIDIVLLCETEFSSKPLFYSKILQRDRSLLH